jgi:hypothetical protein
MVTSVPSVDLSDTLCKFLEIVTQRAIEKTQRTTEFKQKQLFVLQ